MRKLREVIKLPDLERGQFVLLARRDRTPDLLFISIPSTETSTKMPIIVVLPIARKKCGLTQEKLAELSDRSQQLIGKLEQGKAKGVGFETLNQICQVIGKQVGDIVVYIPDDPNQLDETLITISKKLNCSIDEIIPYIPKDLRKAYRRSRLV